MAEQQEHGPCPFEEGDRIDHKLFGFGTVTSAPVAMVGFSDRTYQPVPKGWRMEIVWDDPTRKNGSYGSDALTKVLSPDTRPFNYWNRQWIPLLQTWKTARKAVEDHASTFRPVPDTAKMQTLRDQEDDAWQAMQRFFDEESAGQH